MPERNIQAKARLISLTTEGRAGLLGLARDLRVGPATLIGMLNQMEEEGLVDINAIHEKRAGRPLRLVRATDLGKDFLRAYVHLSLMTLKSRPSDLRKAVEDARYASRLDSRSVPAYKLFLELNENARHTRGPAV